MFSGSQMIGGSNYKGWSRGVTWCHVVSRGLFRGACRDSRVEVSALLTPPVAYFQ
jgi:hypothetical protein